MSPGIFHSGANMVPKGRSTYFHYRIQPNRFPIERRCHFVYTPTASFFHSFLISLQKKNLIANANLIYLPACCINLHTTFYFPCRHDYLQIFISAPKHNAKNPCISLSRQTHTTKLTS